jgi:hypothetical protein
MLELYVFLSERVPHVLLTFHCRYYIFYRHYRKLRYRYCFIFWHYCTMCCQYFGVGTVRCTVTSVSFAVDYICLASEVNISLLVMFILFLFTVVTVWLGISIVVLIFSVCWDFMQCRPVVSYRSLGTYCRSHFKGQSVQAESRNVSFTVRNARFVVASLFFAVGIARSEVCTALSAVRTLIFLPGAALFAIEPKRLPLRVLYFSASSPLCMDVFFFS